MTLRNAYRHSIKTFRETKGDVELIIRHYVHLDCKRVYLQYLRITKGYYAKTFTECSGANI